MRKSRLRIIVQGYIVRGPLGGMAWHNLQYLRALSQLGHEVYFLEDSDGYASCYNPETNMTSEDPGYGLAFAAEVFPRIAMGECWAYHDAHTGSWHGPRAGDMRMLCKEADLLLDLCGVNPMRDWVRRIPRRALVDEDPCFTQIKHMQNAGAMERAKAHNLFFSFGENFGKPGCTIPDDGFPWQPTRQPLAAGSVNPSPGVPDGRFTTVMVWESYPALEHESVRYGLKRESFRPYMDLPKRLDCEMELAVGAEGAVQEALRAGGWRVTDPRVPTRDPWTYERYIAGSKGEFSVAKHGYVVSNSGWFSERSIAYLASGRPVVVEDTGFTSWMDAGSGVLSFRTPEEACAVMEEVIGNYEHHCRAASEMAAAYFDSEAVLGSLLDRCFQSTL
ncbi:MAG: hypothetical protein FJW20_01560 [Acidimicrobiia bacterium]|nr:hypothetical protein [Acidimicrobiia bacterium]